MKIIAHGHYAEKIEDALPPLKELVKEATGEPVRRVGRFIQLALIGAGRCLTANPAPKNTGVYLTSGRGDLEITLDVLEQMVEHGLPPKPLSFINTVSNSACFYLAKHFGLHGRSHFVTRRHAPLESVLQLAALDIDNGAVQSALVGSVDICTMPLADHRTRLCVPADTAVGEGSHWFLLSNDAYPGTTLATIEAVILLPDKDALQQWLATQFLSPQSPANTVLACGQHIDTPTRLLLQHLTGCSAWAASPEPPWYDSHCGNTLGQFLQLRPARTLLHIDSDPAGRFNVLQVSLS
jgi:hypothetical protein